MKVIPETHVALNLISTFLFSQSESYYGTGQSYWLFYWSEMRTFLSNICQSHSCKVFFSRIYRKLLPSHVVLQQPPPSYNTTSSTMRKWLPLLLCCNSPPLITLHLLQWESGSLSCCVQQPPSYNTTSSTMRKWLPLMLCCNSPPLITLHLLQWESGSLSCCVATAPLL